MLFVIAFASVIFAIASLIVCLLIEASVWWAIVGMGAGQMIMLTFLVGWYSVMDDDH